MADNETIKNLVDPPPRPKTLCSFNEPTWHRRILFLRGLHLRIDGENYFPPYAMFTHAINRIECPL